MPTWYPDLLAPVSDRVSAGRLRAVAAVNEDLIIAYRGIGRDVLDRQGPGRPGHEDHRQAVS